MKARTEREALHKALRTVLPAVPKAGSLPVLQGVRLDLVEGELTATCTSLDLTITSTVPAWVPEGGSVVVPASLFEGLVGRLAGGDVELLVDERLHVASGEAMATLAILDPDQWPRVLPAEGDEVTLDADALDVLGRLVAFTAGDSKADARWQSVCFDGAQAMATDSYRMAIGELGVEVPHALVPGSAVRAMLKAAGDEVTLAVADGAATFRSGATASTVRLITGDYPTEQLRHFASTPGPHRLVVAAEPLADALARVGPMADTNVITLTGDGGKLRLAGSKAEVGEITDTVPCEGDFDEVAFNARFLAELVEAVRTDEVTFQLADTLKPAVVEGDRIVVVQMPVRAGSKK